MSLAFTRSSGARTRSHSLLALVDVDNYAACVYSNAVQVTDSTVLYCTVLRCTVRRVLCETQANIRIQNNIHRRQVKQDTALFLRVKYNAILEALKDVRTYVPPSSSSH